MRGSRLLSGASEEENVRDIEHCLVKMKHLTSMSCNGRKSWTIGLGFESKRILEVSQGSLSREASDTLPIVKPGKSWKENQIFLGSSSSASLG